MIRKILIGREEEIEPSPPFAGTEAKGGPLWAAQGLRSPRFGARRPPKPGQGVQVMVAVSDGEL